MGGSRNEVGNKALFEPIRDKTPDIGRHNNYTCDQNMTNTNFVQYDTICVQIYRQIISRTELGDGLGSVHERLNFLNNSDVAP